MWRFANLMDALLSEIMVAPTIPWAVLVLRLAGALLLCGLIGLERESRDRPAGLRTHMMVGLASAVYCIVLLEMIAAFGEGEGQLRLDPVRLIEAVTSGVAFLAAGMIVFAKGEVRGLTTGTSLWLAAAVGLAVGLGLWPVAVLATILALVVVGLLKRAERAARRGESARPASAGSGGDDRVE
ncbi:MAG TPA: MgtC/SapB family protein [Amaricoccus sp.]|uniref:MgtC/SapB family protein n=1 Tax=Amaricoccus sp. TaxID=1872485 RepID=UPI002C551711|nr:MgtC/SapB family protein [Amaricoccus sp.]HPG21603.1 MgtC/SapB family protein [Amaricoccus sp.]